GVGRLRKELSCSTSDGARRYRLGSQRTRQKGRPYCKYRYANRGQMRSNRQWISYRMPLNQPASSSPMVISLGSASPKPLKRSSRSLPAREDRLRKGSGAKRAKTSRRNDKYGVSSPCSWVSRTHSRQDDDGDKVALATKRSSSPIQAARLVALSSTELGFDSCYGTHADSSATCQKGSSVHSEVRMQTPRVHVNLFDIQHCS